MVNITNEISTQNGPPAKPLVACYESRELRFWDGRIPLASDQVNGGGSHILRLSSVLIPEPYDGPARTFLAKKLPEDGLRGGPLFVPSTLQLMETEDRAFGNSAVNQVESQQ
jgi:hypothetical protein